MGSLSFKTKLKALYRWAYLPFTFFGDEAGLLPIIGRDKQSNKEDRWNRNEKKAGDEAEVGGFHYRRWFQREAITDSANKLHF